MGPRAGVDGRKISSPPGLDPGPSNPKSVAIPTELPGPRNKYSSPRKPPSISYVRSLLVRCEVHGTENMKMA